MLLSFSISPNDGLARRVLQKWRQIPPRVIIFGRQMQPLLTLAPHYYILRFNKLVFLLISFSELLLYIFYEGRQP